MSIKRAAYITLKTPDGLEHHFNPDQVCTVQATAGRLARVHTADGKQTDVVGNAAEIAESLFAYTYRD